MYDFCIVGNDKRFLSLEKYLKQENFSVLMYGLEPEMKVKCKYLVLPIPLLNKEKYLNVSKDKITIDHLFNNIQVNNKVFGGGNIDLLPDNLKYFNILADEEFAVKNAVLTAESAVSVLHSVSEKAIYKSNCLVIGYGRIGKVLAGYLYTLKANVTVSARKIKDLAYIESCGYNSVHTNDVNNIKQEYDFIFNTVNAILFDKNDFKKISNDTVFIDLSSYPGCILDEEVPVGCRFIRALGLPGKFLPDSAGELLKDVLIRNIKEDGEILGT